MPQLSVGRELRRQVRPPSFKHETAAERVEYHHEPWALMSGCQLAQEFRKVRPEAKVLLMSGYNVEAAEAYRVELAPGEPFLKKPFTMDELQRAVQAALVYRPPAGVRPPFCCQRVKTG